VKQILQEEEDLSEIVQQLFLSLLLFQFCLLQVTEILQEEEDLSEIVQQLSLMLLFFS
jgi:hypothetical protein